MKNYQKFLVESARRWLDEDSEYYKEPDWSKVKWEGVDVDIEESLFEYGFVVTKDMKEITKPDEYFVLYKINDDAFGTGYYRESELDNIVKGEEWASEKAIKGFLNFTGDNTKEEFLKSRFVDKLQCLISYWGYENILGSEYNPSNKKQALKMINEEE